MKYNMWILVIQSLDEDLEAVLCGSRRRGHLITEIQDQAPVFARIVLGSDSLDLQLHWIGSTEEWHEGLAKK